MDGALHSLTATRTGLSPLMGRNHNLLPVVRVHQRKCLLAVDAVLSLATRQGEEGSSYQNFVVSVLNNLYL